MIIYDGHRLRREEDATGGGRRTQPESGRRAGRRWARERTRRRRAQPWQACAPARWRSGRRRERGDGERGGRSRPLPSRGSTRLDDGDDDGAMAPARKRRRSERRGPGSPVWQRGQGCGAIVRRGGPGRRRRAAPRVKRRRWARGPRPRWDREKERESGERGGVGYWVSVRVWAGVYRERGWAGRLAEWASLLGRLARGSFSLFFVCFLFCSFFLLFIFFSVFKSF